MNHKKIAPWFMLVIIISSCLLTPLPVAATLDTSLKVYDGAGLFNAEQIATLSKTAQEISKQQQIDLVIVTVNSTEGKSAMAYADDFYDYNGFGYGPNASGLLLLIDMEERILWITTTGEAIDLFNDSAIDTVLDAVYDSASSGNFYNAGRTFLSQADSHISSERLAQLPLHKRFSVIERLLFSILIGFGVAALVMFVMVKRHRRSLALPPAAHTYLQDGREQFTKKEDVFINTRTSSVPIPSKTSGGGTSTHRGSSGTRHGGGGRKF